MLFFNENVILWVVFRVYKDYLCALSNKSVFVFLRSHD